MWMFGYFIFCLFLDLFANCGNVRGLENCHIYLTPILIFIKTALLSVKLLKLTINCNSNCK